MRKDDGWFWIGFGSALPVGLLFGFAGGAICYHVWDFGTGVLVGLCIAIVLAFLTYAYASEFIAKSNAREIRREIKNNLVDWYESQGIDTGLEDEEIERW